jgi:alkylhydroperoxidase family enzyme
VTSLPPWRRAAPARAEIAGEIDLLVTAPVAFVQHLNECLYCTSDPRGVNRYDPLAGGYGQGARMTWLAIGNELGTSELDAVLSLQPDGAEALRGLLAATRASIDADLLEPVAVRVAQVLDVPAGLLVELVGLAPEAVDARTDELRSWPDAPALSERQRLAVAHAEQFVIDVEGIGDADIDQLLQVLPADELFRFQVGLGVVERTLRFCRVFEIAAHQPAPAGATQEVAP